MSLLRVYCVHIRQCKDHSITLSPPRRLPLGSDLGVWAVKEAISSGTRGRLMSLAHHRGPGEVLALVVIDLWYFYCWLY